MDFTWLTPERLQEVAVEKGRDRADGRAEREAAVAEGRPVVRVDDWRPRPEDEESLGDECR